MKRCHIDSRPLVTVQYGFPAFWPRSQTVRNITFKLRRNVASL